MYFLLVIAVGLLTLSGAHFILRSANAQHGAKYEMVVCTVVIIGCLYIIYLDVPDFFETSKVHYLHNLAKLVLLTYIGFQVMSAFCYTRNDQYFRHFLLSMISLTLAVTVIGVWWIWVS